MVGWVRAGSKLGLTRQAFFRGKIHYAPIVPGTPSLPFDRMAANGGMNIDAAGTLWKPGIDLAILAITRRCPLECSHCYARSTTGHEESVSRETWLAAIRSLQQIGTGVIALSGGEPMMRFDDLLWLLAHADRHASEFHIHTSGMGVTPERVAMLAEAGITAAAVGLDDVDEERHDRLRGQYGAHQQAVRAIAWFREAGILPYLNMCLTRELVRSGDLWRYIDMAKELNVAFVQMLEPRPTGGFLAEGDGVLLTPEDREEVMRFFTATQDNRLYGRHPIVYYVAHTEHPQQMGCRMGGLSHLSIDGDGNVTPCVFLPVGFGNICQESFEEIYARMRVAIPQAVRSACPSLTLGPVLREACTYGANGPVPYDQIRVEFSSAIGRSTNGVIIPEHDYARRTS